MSVSHGMNSGEVVDLAGLLQRTADRVQGLAEDVDRLAHAAGWSGDDAAGFLQMWPTHRGRLVTVVEGLRGLGQSALNNVSEQLRASAVAGAGIGSVAAVGAMLDSDTGRPAGWSTMSERERIRALSRLDWSVAGAVWATLSLAEQRAIAVAGADFGDLDFVPPVVRYAINREEVQAEYDRITALDRRSPSEQHRHDLYGRLLREHQQILFFDPAGDGRIGVVHGDMVGASDIALQVPGINNTLDNYWTMLDESQRLHGAAGGSDVAVISWLGYDAPGYGTAPFGGFAEAAATSLYSLVASVDEARPDARITVIGHSYGSLVTGLAASRGMPADQVVLVGSPGVGVDSVDAFTRPDGSRPVVLVGQNRSDHISVGADVVAPLGSYYGSNPMSVSFGADHRKPFQTWAPNHSYYGAGSDQLLWLGEIITPEPDLSNVQLA